MFIIYYFLKYIGWVKKNGFFSSAEEMLNNTRSGDNETLYNHLKLVLSYIKQLNVGIKFKLVYKLFGEAIKKLKFVDLLSICIYIFFPKKF